MMFYRDSLFQSGFVLGFLVAFVGALLLRRVLFRILFFLAAVGLCAILIRMGPVSSSEAITGP